MHMTHAPTERLADMDLPIKAIGNIGKLDSIATRTAYLLTNGHTETVEVEQVRLDLRRDLPERVASAFGNGHADAMLDLHKTLYLIYELSFANPLAPAVQHQYAPWLIDIRQTIETSWLDYELRQISDELPKPGVLNVFPMLRDWFLKQSRRASMVDRKVVGYLAEKASIEDFKKFLLADSHLNYRFYDALVLASLHYSESVKAEISRHMWDECGCGDSTQAHTQMFTRTLTSMGLPCPTSPIWEDWRPYAGFNLYFLFGLNRRHYFKALGSLAMPELFDPDRDRAVVKGLERLGFDAKNDFDYYCAHIEVDEEHGDRWLDLVIRPVVETQPAAATDIAIGALLRMAYMRQFNLYLNDLFGLGD